MNSALAWLEVLRRPLDESSSTYALLFDNPTNPDQPMKTTATIIEDLCQLSELDAAKRRLEPSSPRCKELMLEAESVRERLPTAILHHYDLRISKGKRGAARMRNNTCGGCHLSLPSGQLSDLRREDASLQVCGYCSIFILPEIPQPEAAAAPVVEEPVAVKKPRKSKAKAPAAEVAGE
ncbi:MAG: zinc ribbon domain-containing protein [Prosthecobacter sp.]